MSNFYIKKLLQTNLNDIPSTEDIILTLTDQNNLYVNNKQGKNLKISDVVFVDNKDSFNDIIKNNNVLFDKLYVTKDSFSVYIPNIIEEHDTKMVKFTNIHENVIKQISDTDDKIEELTKNINELKSKRYINVSFHIPNKLTMSKIDDFVYIDDIKRNLDDECRINYIKISTPTQIDKDIKFSLYLDDEKLSEIPMVAQTDSNIIYKSNEKVFKNGILKICVDDVGNSPENVHIIVNVEVKNMNK